MAETTQISDERLAEMLAGLPRYEDGAIASNAWTTRLGAQELASILTELTDLRLRLLAAEKVPTEEQLEVAAQAVFQVSRDQFYVLFPKAVAEEWDWSTTSDDLRDMYRAKARAVVEALSKIRATQ